MMRKRILGLALIALAVPFPALALEGGGAEATGLAGPQRHRIARLLRARGLADHVQDRRRLEQLEGADSYTVSVTSADGSVIDMGETTGQGTSVWVPYVGLGHVLGLRSPRGARPPGEEDDGTPEVIARSTSLAGGEIDGVAKTPPEAGSDDARSRRGRRTRTSEDPVHVDGDCPDEPRDETPVCEEPPVEEPPLPPAPESRAAGEESRRGVRRAGGRGYDPGR